MMPRSAMPWAVLVCILAIPAIEGEDCNGNGVDDATDILPGPLTFEHAISREIELGLHVVGGLAAHLDGDGLIDLVILESDEGVSTTRLAFGAGGGRFELDREFRAPVSVDRVADLDGDGRADLLAGSDFQPGSEPGLHVWYQSDGRRFEGHFFAGPRATASQVVDVESDGDLDVVAGRSIYVNEGGRRFAVRTLPEVGLPPVVVAAHIDDDGRVDFIDPGDGGGGVVTIFRSFAPDEILAGERLPVGERFSSLRAADADDDGDTDLLLWTTGGPGGSGAVLVLVNDGRGTFAPPFAEPGRVVQWAQDLDGDGRTDIAGREGDHLVVATGIGGGRHADAHRYFVGGTRSSIIALADADGDRVVDVIGASPDLLVRPAGMRFWWSPGVPANGPRGGVEFELPRSLATDVGLDTLAEGDFDGDGDLDVVGAGIRFAPTQGWVTTVKVLAGDGHGGWTETFSLDTRLRRGVASMGDVDDDGDLDVVLGGVVYENVGGGTLVGEEILEPAGFPFPAMTLQAVADLDGDGGLDTASAAMDAATVRVRFGGQGGGGVETILTLPDAPQPEGAGIMGLEAADVDGDGDEDLVIAHSVSGLRVLRNRGGAEFDIEAPLPVASSSTQGVRVADLNGDGRPDLIEATIDELTVRFGRGAAFEAPVVSRGVNAPPLLVADIDADGDLDVIGPTSVALNDGEGGLGAPVELPRFVDRPTLVFDVDGDGRIDLLRSSRIPQEGVEAGHVTTYLNRTPRPVSVDADGDGVPDECGERRRFRRGDVDADGRASISDAVTVLGYLFRGAGTPPCLEAADADNDGAVAIGDAIVILNHLFRGSAPPAPPGPPPGPCGFDPDAIGSIGDLGCLDYGSCP